ncbi:Uncharacterized protein CK203_050551 [Vitis vinifera]|uniref:Uncharacterized protein n=1 Tax=Vitis vinifera TaxID=29760 RepID=A0A438GFG9_VITVI|nr:Uncharacterized protein CK203_050551 [Vitis vinifera]
MPYCGLWLLLLQVFGEKAFEKYGKGFISMHFSDQQLGTHKKDAAVQICSPDAKNMGDMTRLVALIPYYIDLIGRYKLSSQVGKVENRLSQIKGCPRGIQRTTKR